MANDKLDHNPDQIDTGGGAYINDSVDTGGGDFVGRDQYKLFSVFRDVKQLVVFLLLVVATLSIIAFGYWQYKQPRPMSGDFNIAVAQFGELTENGIKATNRAEKIRNSLFNNLDSEFKATEFGLELQTSQKNMPMIVEDAEAESLASKINADMVIYGEVFATENAAEFMPRFYIAERPDTAELTGQNQLALPIEFDILELSYKDEINVKLRTRAAILVNFTKGLIYLTAENLDAASLAFSNALQEIENHGYFEGQEVIYLISAETSRLQEDLDQAEKYLQEAFNSNPEYARAFIAQGNIYYDQALMESFDKSLLEKAQDAYQKAIDAKDQPVGAYIREKSNVALGNIYVIEAQQTNDPDLFLQAIYHYTQVTDEYKKSKNEGIREIAAIAYFGLGAAYERQDNYSEAEKAYQESINLTNSSKLKERAETQIEIVKQ